MVKARWANNRINGLQIGNNWSSDPSKIKIHAHNFFEEKFRARDSRKPSLRCEGLNKLSDHEALNLIAPFTCDEIKVTVWDCGGDKAPGPDGFNFDFLKSFWDILGGDFLKRPAKIGGVSADLSLGVYTQSDFEGSRQSFKTGYGFFNLGKYDLAFVANRNIVDGPLIINEILSWLKQSKLQAMFFRIDFNKAYDSLDWDFIDSILAQMNFPERWRIWVQGLLKASRSSVLINGAPTKEFDMFRGVRQGDPLSPYLFILALEAFHWMLSKATSMGIFHGLSLPQDGPVISHLFFADDALILGQWSSANFINLRRLLRCFFLVSGLQVNLHKCGLTGLNVDELEIKTKAEILGCKLCELPFDYLGLKVGANMNQKKHWKKVIDTFQKRLSGWKIKSLSMGGRLVLIKSVLNALPTYYFSLYRAPKKVLEVLEKIRCNFFWGGSDNQKKIHWVARQNILKPKEKGGLGIEPLEYSNISLLAKWFWRYNTEPSRLWRRVIDAIHVNRRHFTLIPVNPYVGGVWKAVNKICEEIEKVGINLQDHLVYANGVIKWKEEKEG
ncbi:hypothetical protein SSX86_030038 [Deinandra increscens subsp. villosa]|uniref:Reverse transcriptase domain-containing protein n=1 Tax=Deinandra increscens subsp. villosa TaxID=3103831 RepID=A0AAP0CAR0_9ASTR